MALTLGDLNLLIGADISRLEAAFAAVDKGVGQLGDKLKSAGSTLTVAVTAPLTLLGGAALDAFGKIEKLQKGLTAVATQQINANGITGIEAISQAASETAGRLKELETLAKAPGLGFSQAVQGDIRLRAVGISAEQSTKSIKEFANAIATTGGGRGEFDRVTVQLGQLSAKGKVLAQDLRPIIEAAPAVAGALQQLYGTVDSEDISKALEKQGKSSKDFIATLTDELAKLPRVAGSFSDTVENFQESGTRSLAKIGNALNARFNIDQNLNKLGDFLTGLADKFDALDPATQKLVFGLAAGAAAAGPLLFGFGAILSAVPSVVAGLEALGIASTAALGPIGLGALAVAAGAALIIKNWDQLVAYFGGGGLGGQLFPNLAESVTNAINEILGALSLLTGNNFGDLITSGGIVKDLVQSIAVGFTALADVVGGTIGAITRLLKGDFSGSLEQAKRAIIGVFEPIGALFGYTKTKSDALSGSFRDAFEPIEEVAGLMGGDLAAALGKVAALTEDQQKALDKLRKELRENERASLAFGDSLTKTGEKYDFLGTKAKILEGGVKSLTDVGFAAGGRVVQGYLAQLDRVPEAVERVAKRVAKGLEKVGDTPEFKVQTPDIPKLPDTLFAPPIDTTATEASLTRFAAVMGLFKESLKTNVDEIASTIASGFEGIASSIGNALVNGTSLIAAAGGAILKALGDLAVKKGALLIADGTANLFVPGLQGLGVATIAAGVGLVAAGTAVGAYGSSLSNGGGRSPSLGGSGGNYSSPSSTKTEQSNTLNIVVEMKLRGEDIVGIGKLRNYRNLATD